MMETERLLLRSWREEDRAPFRAMNADPAVMEFFPKLLTAEESDAMVGRIENHFEERGFGPWAVEVKGVAPFIGYVGLVVPGFEAHFTPCVEVGWRLAAEHWGMGYATEGARAAIDFGFNEAGLGEIVSMTTVHNLRSRHVMEKIGMTHDPGEDFDHPLIPEGEPIRRHVLYRVSR